METPPRAWGKPLAIRDEPKLPRNTPTGVGKTTVVQGWFQGVWKHPHGRGENYM